MHPSITTNRLILRPWKEEDLEPFAKINADPRVMEYFPSVLTSKESDAFASRMLGSIQKQGFGFWAACLKESGTFIGLIGLENVHFEAHFTPAIEIGWRLAYEHWGKGYATEGALACLKYGFEILDLSEIVSFTSLLNKRSMAVMEKIGMHRNANEDFNHPKLLKNHTLRRHVLYRLQKTLKSPLTK